MPLHPLKRREFIQKLKRLGFSEVHSLMNISINKFFPLFFSLFLFQITIFSQDNLFLPLNVKQADDKGTRAYNGMPGKNYWQNAPDYKIKVEVEPSSRLLKGSEQVTYYNNSPDTLT